MNALVIGYGNPLRGDDGLGWRAAHRLREERSANPLGAANLKVIACQQLTPELSDPISKSDLVVFIDAREGAPAGLVRTEHVEPMSLAPGSCAVGTPGSLSHYVSPAALLACAQIIYGRAPEAVLISVTAEEFEGERLSPATERALEQVLREVRQLIAEPADTTGAKRCG